MSNTIKLIIPQAEMANAKAIMDLLSVMSQEQQKDLLSFLRGVAFGQTLTSR